MAAEHNIEIDQGSTWTKAVTWQDSNATPYDLTSHTARMMIRKKYADEDKSAPLVSLTHEDGITLGDTVDNVVIVIDDLTTEGIPAGTYYYDLELISPSEEVTKLLRGKAFILAEVTR